MTAGARPRVGVGAVILQDGNLLMIKRGRPPRQGQWAVPGGKVRWGETLHEAVVREVREETGLEVKVDELVWVGETIGEDWHFILLDFAAHVLGGVLEPADDADEAVWVPLSEVDRLPITSSMTDLLNQLRGAHE